VGQSPGQFRLDVRSGRPAAPAPDRFREDDMQLPQRRAEVVNLLVSRQIDGGRRETIARAERACIVLEGRIPVGDVPIDPELEDAGYTPVALLTPEISNGPRGDGLGRPWRERDGAVGRPDDDRIERVPVIEGIEQVFYGERLPVCRKRKQSHDETDQAVEDAPA